MSKAKILKLKTEVTKMESVYSKSSTSDKTKAILKKAIDKAKGEIEKLEGKAAKKEPAKKEPKAAAEPKTRKKRKKATPLERLKSLVKRKKYSAYSKTGVDLEKDAGQPALPTGKRKSKSGKTYYEYRANRIDVKQPPKRYPKLENGGMMAEGGFFDKKEDVVFKFQEGEKIKVLQYSGGKLKPLEATIYKKYAAEQPDGTYYPFYWTVGSWEDFEEGKKHPSLYAEDELIDRHKNKPKMADGGMMARGGIYSSEELYIVKVFDGKSGELLDMSKRVWAKNISQAQRMAMEDFEDEMKAKYGDHLRFKVEEAPSMMKKGGYMADGASVAKLKTKLDFDINEVVSDVISKINLVKSSEDDYNYMIDGVVNKLSVVQFTLLNKKEPTNIPAKKEGSNSVLNAEIDKIVSDVLDKVKAAQNSPEQYKFMINNIIDKLRKYKKEYGGYMADGGKIKDQYDGREPEDIWNNLSKMQRQHFIYDHASEIEGYRGEEYGELKSSEIMKAYNSDYDKLDKNIKNRFNNHVRQGQYKSGGSLDIDSYADGGELKKDYLVTFDSQTQDFQPTTFQASSIYDLMETLRETVPAEVEILSIEQMTPHGVMEYGGVMGY